MERQDVNGLTLLRFPLLSELPGIIHGVALRHGGVSKSPYASLNLADGGDDPKDVAQNRERLRRALGLEKLCFVKQVHGQRIVSISGDEDSPAAEADGLCIDRPGVGLLIKQADCQAVILVAPGRAVANLHVGWRGNVVDMPGRGVRFFCQTYGLEPAGLYATISPALGPCCAQFVNHADELGPDFLPYMTAPDHFDLFRVTIDQLIRAGVRPKRIQAGRLCTKCGDDFFSYRREGETGRFGTVVALAA